MWWNKHKWKVIAPVMILAVLAGAFYLGGNSPGARGWSISNTPAPSSGVTANVSTTPDASPPTGIAEGLPPEPTQSMTPETTKQPTQPPEQSTAPADTPAPAETARPAETPPPSKAPVTPEPTMVINPETGKDKYQTDPVPEGKPLPVEPQDVKIGTTAYTCTISISCATILDNLDLCDPEKVELVPEDGWILKPTVVTFYEGESVFNVLQRTCKQLGIHMEYTNTPIYNSAYIEGIHNLYEFDVGELSGWMYKVNGWFPNYGCSRYQLKDGDVIHWVYTCDLGNDVGGGYAAGSLPPR